MRPGVPDCQGPFTGESGCRWLIERGVKAVGYDYPPDFCIRDSIATPRRKPARDEYTTHALFFPVGIYMVLALGLNIVVGAAGLLDLGYVAFYAVGAYTTATLTTSGHWSVMKLTSSGAFPPAGKKASRPR